MSFRPVLGPTHPPYPIHTGAVSPGIMYPGSEADHSSPASAKRIHGSIDSLLYVSFWHCMQLIKLRDKYTFTLLFFALITFNSYTNYNFYAAPFCCKTLISIVFFCISLAFSSHILNPFLG
jgi:hypothetical protein